MPKIPSEPFDTGVAINAIRDHHRTIEYCIKQQSRADRSLEALVAVRVFGYLPKKGDADGAKVFKQAAERIKDALSADDSDPLHSIAAASELSRAPWDKVRHAAELAMAKLVRKLPVWDHWAEGVPGLGAVSLGHVIGETSDLSNYATVSRVWKRLGLAVINGHRQGAPGKGATAEDWIAEGYKPARRSVVYVMADTLFRRQSMVAGPYRAIYDRRKAYELERGIPLGHAHNRARRYMSKALIADLWSAWREASDGLITDVHVPHVTSLDDGQCSRELQRAFAVVEREAIVSLHTSQTVPRATSSDCGQRYNENQNSFAAAEQGSSVIARPCTSLLDGAT